MKPIAVTFAALVALAGISWFIPLFHVVPLQKAEADKLQAAFNAADFAKTFWNERLMKSLDKAADATKIVSEIGDPKKIREQFGRSVGLSESYFLFLRGSGRIISTSGKGVNVSLQDAGSEPDAVLLTGLLFGNTVRDATGLLDPSAFPNSQHFNDISTELNRIIETQVIPDLKERAKVGGRIEFVGCAEVADEDRDLKPLKIIPVSVKFK